MQGAVWFNYFMYSRKTVAAYVTKNVTVSIRVGSYPDVQYRLTYQHENNSKQGL